jgi:hypothetical protein
VVGRPKMLKLGLLTLLGSWFERSTIKDAVKKRCKLKGKELAAKSEFYAGRIANKHL